MARRAAPAHLRFANWSTGEADIDATVEAIATARAAVLAEV